MWVVSTAPLLNMCFLAKVFGQFLTSMGQGQASINGESNKQKDLQHGKGYYSLHPR
jgi:hypothetical protein